MCLKMYDNAPKVAEEDIVCYKFLQRNQYNLLLSPYKMFIYRLGFEYSAECNVCETEYLQNTYNVDENNNVTDIATSTILKRYKVEEGLHTIANLSDATEFANTWTETYLIEYVVVEGIIPKGATYYEGTWCERPSYASSRLTVTKVIGSYVTEEN